MENQTGHKFAGKSKIKVSFKTIERLSSDPEVMLAIYNLRILLFEKGINESNITVMAQVIHLFRQRPCRSGRIKFKYKNLFPEGRNYIIEKNDIVSVSCISTSSTFHSFSQTRTFISTQMVFINKYLKS